MPVKPKTGRTDCDRQKFLTSHLGSGKFLYFACVTAKNKRFPSCSFGS